LASNTLSGKSTLVTRWQQQKFKCNCSKYFFVVFFFLLELTIVNKAQKRNFSKMTSSNKTLRASQPLIYVCFPFHLHTHQRDRKSKREVLGTCSSDCDTTVRVHLVFRQLTQPFQTWRWQRHDLYRSAISAKMKTNQDLLVEM
jgi:hypothetical protein